MTGISANEARSAAADVAVVRELSDALWRAFGRYRGTLDMTEFGDAALSVVYLRGRPTWAAVISGGVDVEQAMLDDLSADGVDPVVVRPVLDSVRKVGEARQLAQLIDTADRFDLDRSIPPAKAFSALLDRLSLAAGRKGGEFHTPEAITGLVATLLDPAPSARILDPCCKGGGFPAAIVERLIEQDKTLDKLTVEISDYSERSSALAYLNLRLRGLESRVLPRAYKALPTGAPDRLYDVVTANPPFNVSHWDDEGRVDGRWRYSRPPIHNANFAWLQYVVASLDQGGRAAVIMPNGAGTSENVQEHRIRAAMLDDGVISAVIALPGQMFTSTDIPVTLWLLQSPLGHAPDDVLFVDATGLGSVRGRGRRTLVGPDIERIADTYREWCGGGRRTFDGFAIGVPVDEIRAHGYRLNPRAYVRPIKTAPDLHAQARQVTDLVQQLGRLAEEAGRLDQSIEAHLKELSP